MLRLDCGVCESRWICLLNGRSQICYGFLAIAETFGWFFEGVDEFLNKFSVGWGRRRWGFRKLSEWKVNNWKGEEPWWNSEEDWTESVEFEGAIESWPWRLVRRLWSVWRLGGGWKKWLKVVVREYCENDIISNILHTPQASFQSLTLVSYSFSLIFHYASFVLLDVTLFNSNVLVQVSRYERSPVLCIIINFCNYLRDLYSSLRLIRTWLHTFFLYCIYFSLKKKNEKWVFSVIKWLVPFITPSRVLCQ